MKYICTLGSFVGLFVSDSCKQKENITIEIGTSGGNSSKQKESFTVNGLFLNNIWKHIKT